MAPTGIKKEQLTHKWKSIYYLLTPMPVERLVEFCFGASERFCGLRNSCSIWKSKKESDGSVQLVQHNPSLWIQGFRRLGLLCRTSCMESGKGLFTISSASAVQENAAALVCCRRSRNVLRTTKFNPKMEIQSSSIHSLVDEKGTVPPTFKVNEMLSLSVQRKVFHEVICWNTLSWQFI